MDDGFLCSLSNEVNITLFVSESPKYANIQFFIRNITLSLRLLNTYVVNDFVDVEV